MVWADDVPENACACCGRPLRPGNATYWVEVIDGGEYVARPGWQPDADDPGYMGAHQIGPSCARKHFKGFYHKQDG